jgi:polysaccharide biosynthesis/export protein
MTEHKFWALLRRGLSRRAMVRACAGAALALVSTQAAAAQEAVGSHARDQVAARSSPADESYRIGPGDVLEIRVYKLQQLSREAVRVENNGIIRMPLLNEIKAACRTESELSREIAAGYERYMRNPQVDVFIKEYNSRPVAVIGAVNSPGRFQLQRRIRLLELLSFAGGPAERAGANIQIVHSAPPSTCDDETSAANDDAQAAINTYTLDDTLRGGAQSNPYIIPGDIITLLEAEQVFVVGNVLKPSTIPLKEKITVSQAIAMSGGTLPDTQSNRVRIVRQEPGSNTKREIIVDLKAISSRRAEDVALLANDIVEVPTAGGKRFLRHLLSSALPSLGRLPVQIVR